MKKSMMFSGLICAAWLLAPVAMADDAKTPAAAVSAPATKATDASKTKAQKAVVSDTKSGAGTMVELKTSEGMIRIELADKQAPISVKNFLGYVSDKFYDGTVFHRVIDSFMVQGGGYTVEGDKFSEKKTKAPITNEANNGLKNDKGTLAMARTGDPDSATAQFFINLVNNDRLNYPNPDGHGYAVFGKVVDGLDVVEKIGRVKTGIRMGMQDVPLTDIKIISVSVVKAASH